MALMLGPIARPSPTERRPAPPAAESFDARPTPNGRSAATAPPERADATVAAGGSPAASHPARRATPQGGPASVGCECCGRLATADTHLPRTAPPATMAVSSSAADRVAARYLSNARGPLDDETPRSVVS